MNIYTWNINGIRARQEALSAWLESRKPDIVVLEEVKAREEEIPESIASIEGYRKFWNGSSFRKGYSGVGLLVRDGLFDDAHCEVPPFDVENRTLVLRAPQFTLIGTYVPRGDGAEHYAVKLRYLADLKAFIADLLAEGRQVVLAGDMNVALTEIDVHRSQNKPGATGLRPEERAAIGEHLELGLHDIVRELNPDKKDLFTWWPNWKFARERNLGWRIDCLYLTDALAGKVSGVSVDLDEKSSDHAPVSVELSL
ncbi:exodeoxyribonuclease III [Chlorobaculum thiosulfatiphilum]|uniref:Exodeoxyribonuclease III n=1 Tax=Chlorobaculum thiosulfatiphilum TaxID=115852 RepID=A0A5C4S5Y0_CHLTI|nr:exodeoxyribonuclease III [Chlorobaculum thiosulfatiphilum]TNJ38695.1 exodeoxyribonuclease III [Chlorobaculum thiosulfatiphilum]